MRRQKRELQGKETILRPHPIGTSSDVGRPGSLGSKAPFDRREARAIARRQKRELQERETILYPPIGTFSDDLKRKRGRGRPRKQKKRGRGRPRKDEAEKVTAQEELSKPKRRMSATVQPSPNILVGASTSNPPGSKIKHFSSLHDIVNSSSSYVKAGGKLYSQTKEAIKMRRYREKKRILNCTNTLPSAGRGKRTSNTPGQSSASFNSRTSAAKPTEGLTETDLFNRAMAESMKKKQSIARPGDRVIIVKGAAKGSVGVVRNARHGYHVVLVRLKRFGDFLPNREKRLYRKMSVLCQRSSMMYPQNVRLRNFEPPGWIPLNKRKTDLALYSGKRWLRMRGIMERENNKRGPGISMISKPIHSTKENQDEFFQYARSDDEDDLVFYEEEDSDYDEEVEQRSGNAEAITYARTPPSTEFRENAKGTSTEFFENVEEICSIVKQWMQENGIEDGAADGIENRIDRNVLTSIRRHNARARSAEKPKPIGEMESNFEENTTKVVQLQLPAKEIECFARDMKGSATDWPVTRPHLWRIAQSRGFSAKAFVERIFRAIMRDELAADIAEKIANVLKDGDQWTCWTKEVVEAHGQSEVSIPHDDCPVWGRDAKIATFQVWQSSQEQTPNQNDAPLSSRRGVTVSSCLDKISHVYVRDEVYEKEETPWFMKVDDMPVPKNDILPTGVFKSEGAFNEYLHLTKYLGIQRTVEAQANRKHALSKRIAPF